MATNISGENRCAFQALTSGGRNDFAVYYIFVDGKPAVGQSSLVPLSNTSTPNVV